jgi:hypothetical protein
MCIVKTFSNTCHPDSANLFVYFSFAKHSVCQKLSDSNSPGLTRTLSKLVPYHALPACSAKSSTSIGRCHDKQLFFKNFPLGDQIQDPCGYIGGGLQTVFCLPVKAFCLQGDDLAAQTRNRNMPWRIGQLWPTRHEQAPNFVSANPLICYYSLLLFFVISCVYSSRDDPT